jgi:hypothetical protein
MSESIAARAEESFREHKMQSRSQHVPPTRPTNFCTSPSQRRPLLRVWTNSSTYCAIGISTWHPLSRGSRRLAGTI